MSSHIRWMVRRDLPEVLAIENASFPFPWDEEDLKKCLRQRNAIGMVVEHAEKVVGYMIYEIHENKLHILNFAVGPSWRRNGFGEAMIDKLNGKLSNHRRRRYTIEVRESNTTAQLFFKAMALRAVKVLRRFYPDTNEDAYLMECHPYGVTVEEELVSTNRITQHVQQED